MIALTMRSVATSIALCTAFVVAGCHTAPTPSELASSTSRSEWNASLAQSQQEVSAGRYGIADRVLADFATHYPASADAPETLFWRALYKLDPANQSGTAREAAVLLEQYLATSQPLHRAEAQTLRRVTTALDARATASAPAAGPANDRAPSADDKAKDAELQKTKDELAKANAELERIKKRLSRPKP